METRVDGGRGSEARGRGIGLWLVFGLVLLLRVPFLNQAIQGDDHIYLSEAAHALVDPLHPQNAKYVFQGEEVDLRGHPHPPLNAWVLAGLIGVVGDVREVPFHAAYIVFSLIAAWAMWSLAGRFSLRPGWATVLFLLVPAFVVNGNSLETDVPFLAFWMAAIALFCSGRLLLSAAAMALAAMTAYQAVLLTPILAVYVWLYRPSKTHTGRNPASHGQVACATPGLAPACGRGGTEVPRGRKPALLQALPRFATWLTVLTPVVTVAGWQIVQRVTAGGMPASQVMGYSAQYGFLSLHAKLQNALALAIHFWFIVFPALVPFALLAAWRKRREPGTLFLLAWIGIFFAGALVIFFAGAARYLLPIAAPVAILASHLKPKWLAAGAALQSALSVGLAVVSWQHWDGYRAFAESLRGPEAGHRVWVDGEWGLRYYLESDGALPLRRTQRLRAGDIVVSSELGGSVPVNAPVARIAAREIRPAIPLRTIGLETHSGYSTCALGFWPFGLSSGAIDRLRAGLVEERHPTLTYLPMNAPEAATQIVSGIYGLEDNRFRWMSRRGTVALKSPPVPSPLRVEFAIPDQAPARKVTLLLDGHEVASAAYTAPGSYVLESPGLVQPAGASTTVDIEIDRTFSAPGDSRDLGIVLTGAGFGR